MNMTCAAPECKKIIKVTFLKYLSDCFASLARGAQFNAMYFCSEHLERITAGRVSDGDPNTNPDLNKCAKEVGTHVET